MITSLIRHQERCYCGDPECKHCFPFASSEPDEDAVYEVVRQQEIDDDAKAYERGPADGAGGREDWG